MLSRLQKIRPRFPFRSQQHISTTRTTQEAPAKLSFFYHRNQQATAATHNLIVLHGLLGNGQIFQFLSKDQQVATKSDMYFMNLRGHGRSEIRENMTPSEMASDIFHFIQSNKITGPTTIMGHSFGGIIAMHAAIKYPSLFESIIVVDISPFDYFNHPRYMNKRWEFEHILETMQTTRLDQSFQDIRREIHSRIPIFSVAKLILNNIYEDSTGEFRWMVSPSIILNNLRKFTSCPLEGTFDKPIKVIAGELSEYMSEPEDYLPLFERYFPKFDPQLDLSIIKGSGHWPHVEKRQEFVSEISSFLDRNKN